MAECRNTSLTSNHDQGFSISSTIFDVESGYSNCWAFELQKGAFFVDKQVLTKQGINLDPFRILQASFLHKHTYSIY